MKPFIVSEHACLLEYLLKTLHDQSKTKVRQALKHGLVSVNEKTTTRFDLPLVPGDRVWLRSSREPKSSSVPQAGIRVIFEDDWLIVIEKPAGLLTIATETVSRQTAFYWTNQYVLETAAASLKKERSRHFPKPRGKQIFVVHRLDREASGLLVFAKSFEVKQQLQTGWHLASKKYYAVVEGIPSKPFGTITSFLRENKRLSVYSTSNPRDAKRSTTHYRTVRTCEKYALLEVGLETGRKHQIRVHLSEMGHPIVGDERYGSKTDPMGRLGLHAFHLSFPHPVTGEQQAFESPLPVSFEKIFLSTAASK